MKCYICEKEIEGFEIPVDKFGRFHHQECKDTESREGEVRK